MTRNHEKDLLTLALDLILWDRPDRFAVDAKGDIYLCGIYLPENVVDRLCNCRVSEMLEEVANRAKQTAENKRDICTTEETT